MTTNSPRYLIPREDWQQRQQAKDIIHTAKTQAEQLLSQAKITIERDRQAAYSTAKEAGFKEGRAEGLAKAHAQAMDELHRAIATHQRMIATIETHIHDLVYEVMEKLFFMTDTHERILALIRHALTHLDVRSGELRLSVHPDQMTRLEAQRRQWCGQFPSLQCRLIADRSLSLEAYRIEGDGWRAEGDALSTFAQISGHIRGEVA